MKNQNVMSNLSKGIICVLIAAFCTVTVQAKPLDITLKSDTSKMAKKKMGKKMDKKMMKKDSTSKM